mgnify:CR=1 FL=1
MKRTIILAIILLLASATGSCSCDNPKKSIKKVAFAYLDAMANYRIDDAEPYCTDETRNGVLETGRQLVKAVKPGYIESDTPAKVKITGIEITSDTTATVSYHKKTPIKKQDGEVNLVLRDGKWLVHIVMRNVQKKNSDAHKADEPQQIDLIRDTVKGREILGFPTKPAKK